MSLYNIISTGSGEIINIFEWNGIDEIFIPPGYIASLNTTESIQIPIAYEDIVSSSMDNILTDIFVGDSYGSFNSKYIDTVAITADTLISKNIVNSGVIITSGSTEFSGSVNITGSLFINDKKIEKLLDNGKYGTIMYNSSIFTNECPYPLTFRVNNSENNPLEPGSWTNNSAPVTKLSICTNVLSREINGQIIPVQSYVDRRQFLYDIVFNGYLDSRISLRSTDVENTIKRFLVKNGTYYRADIMPGSYGLYPAIINYVEYFEFGSQEVKISTAQEIYDKFNAILIDRPGTYTYLEYFELDVVEYYSNFYPDEPGANKPQSYTVDFGQEFFFDGEIVIPSKRKEIHIIEESQDWEMPSWADKLTVYAVGAGGGGGGGASGHGHEPTISFNGFYGADPKTGDIFDELKEIIEKGGHEIVTGGGGGGGGNISISTFNTSQVPKNSILNIQIGVGGVGGDGVPYSLDFYTRKFNENELYKRYNGILDKNGFVASFPLYFIPILVYSGVEEFAITKNVRGKTNTYGVKYNGGKGSDTLITINGNPTPIIKATGGLGGVGGFALQSYWQTWHRVCGISDHVLPLPYVPGGGSTKLDSKGDTIILGGSGAYGVSTPELIKVVKSNGVTQDYPKINSDTLYFNDAPNIPWNANQIPSLKLPYGHTSINMDSLDVYTVNSFETPTEIAPPGGGGGCGVWWPLVDNRDFKYIYGGAEYYEHEQKNYWNGDIPSNYTLVVSGILNDFIKLGSGGKNLLGTTMFDDTDSNGQRFVVNLGEGGNGGYDNYGIPKDSQLGNTLPNSLQNPGIGSGGGGGAAKYLSNYYDKEIYPDLVGQSGGDGGDGLVILVVEQL